jgi:hypothetical protein
VNQDILIPDKKLRLLELERFRNAPFEKMIKFALDVRLRRIALGGEMHADAVEYISLINIRPAAENRSMDIQIYSIRAAAEEIVREWLDYR